MIRSGGIRGAAFVAVILTVVEAATATEPASVKPPPDLSPPSILYILADDLGYRELGAYGQTKIRTPNLDRLAAQGLRFTNHYSGSPVCAPSRCVLMTGRHTGHTPIRGNKEVGGWGPEEPEGQWPLPDEEVTVAERLRDRGYATGFVGKWGLGGPGSVGHPNRQGFDHFYGYLCQRVAHNYYPTHLWRNSDVDVLHGNHHFRAHQRLETAPTDPADYDRYRGEDYAPAAMADEAIEFIIRHRDKPFALFYASPIPHVALQAPPAFVAEYPEAWDETPYLGDRGYLPCRRPRATYAAMITYLDHVVGRLLDTLDEYGLANRTLVMFSSDNGTTFNGGCDRAFFGSLDGLRGTKCTVYEGGIRVPMLARWPGRIAPGRVTGHVSGFQDVLPTLVELSGGRTPEGIDGISFVPTLLGRDDQPRHEYLYWEYPESDQQQAIRLGDSGYKAVRLQLRRGEIRTQLYDLDRDPAESDDISDDHPEIVARLETLMRQARVPSTDFPIAVLDRP